MLLEGYDVFLEDGRTITNTDVLFKDNGWIRVTGDPEYIYYPPGKVKSVRQRDV